MGENKKTEFNYLLLIPAALQFIAIADLPHGYFTFLRIVVALFAGIIAYHEYEISNEVNSWVVAFVLMLILFNPIIPIHLVKGVWTPINIICGILFCIKSVNFKSE